MKYFLLISVMAQLLLTMLNISVKAQTLMVTPGGAGLKDGSSWTNALDSVAFRSSLRKAVKGDTFWVSLGTYTPANNRDSSFNIPSGVKVYGGFGGFELALNQRDYITYTTILSGDIGTIGSSSDNSYHVVRFNQVDTGTTIDGFTIAGGNGNSKKLSTLAGAGAGIINNGFKGKSNPVIANCIFSNNTAYVGGAIFNLGDSSGNANPSIWNCSFLNNEAFSNGGAIYNSGNAGTSSPTISQCIFTNNKVLLDSFQYPGGAAVFNMGESHGQSSPVFTNCLFTHNITDSSGGAVYNDGLNGHSNATFTNCTFADNTANMGGAIFNNTLYGGSCTVKFTNCILWNDSSTAIGSNEIYTGGASITMSYSDIKGGWTGAHNKNAAPMFYNENKSDYRILPCSPTIDSGTAIGVPVTDLLGNKRPVNGGFDMGAYEYQGKSGKTLVPSITLKANPGIAVCTSITLITFTAVPLFGGNNPSFHWKKNGIKVGINDSIYRDSSIVLGDKITCTLTSNSACLSTTTVTSLPDSIIQASLPLVNTGKLSGTGVCMGIGRHIGGFVSLGYSYKWKPNKALSSDTISSPFVNPTVNTTYTLTVIDHNTGCSNTDSIALVINPIPLANAGGNKAVCYGTPTTIGTAPTINYVYNWFPATGLSSSTSSNPKVTITAAAKYQVIVVDNITKCQNVDSISLTINPLPTVHAGISDTVCTGGKAVLGSVAIKGVLYSWTPASGLNSTTASNPTATVFSTTTYTVTATDSITGCVATDSVNVKVNPFYSMGIINSHYNMYWATSYSAIKYKWSVSNYDSIIKGQGTDTLTVIWKTGFSGSKATIKVYALVPCSDTSSLSANVGINDIYSGDVSFEVYPNPATDNMTLKISNGKGRRYNAEIIDITGRIVSTLFSSYKANAFTYNIGALSAGTYFLKLTDEKGINIIRKISIVK